MAPFPLATITSAAYLQQRNMPSPFVAMVRSRARQLRWRDRPRVSAGIRDQDVDAAEGFDGRVHRQANIQFL